MSLSVEVDFTGVDDTLDDLAELPGEFRRVVANKIQKAVLKGSNVAKKRLTQKQSGYSEGLLRSSIRPFTSVDGLTAGVQAGGSKTSEGGFDYAMAVEFGTRPHFPPVKAVTGTIESLDIWVRRMNPSPPDGMEDDSQDDVNEAVAFLVARHIGRYGTKQKPFMRPGFNAAQGKLVKELRNIEDDLDL